MKKSLMAGCFIIACLAACNNGSTTDAAKSDTAKSAESRAKEIRDSTAMLDKKLADTNSTYSPDSLNNK